MNEIVLIGRDTITGSISTATPDGKLNYYGMRGERWTLI